MNKEKGHKDIGASLADIYAGKCHANWTCFGH